MSDAGNHARHFTNTTGVGAIYYSQETKPMNPTGFHRKVFSRAIEILRTSVSCYPYSIIFMPFRRFCSILFSVALISTRI